MRGEIWLSTVAHFPPLSKGRIQESGVSLSNLSLQCGDLRVETNGDKGSVILVTNNLGLRCL